FALQRPQRGKPCDVGSSLPSSCWRPSSSCCASRAGEFDTVITAATFEAARENRTTPRAFLHRMPKGGDLQPHLPGAVYAHPLIAWAAQQELCTDPQKVVVPKPQCDRAGAVRASDAMRDQQLYNQLVDAFSMRAFLPTPAVPTGHDEFFAAFEK